MTTFAPQQIPGGWSMGGADPATVAASLPDASSLFLQQQQALAAALLWQQQQQKQQQEQHQQAEQHKNQLQQQLQLQQVLLAETQRQLQLVQDQPVDTLPTPKQEIKRASSMRKSPPQEKLSLPRTATATTTSRSTSASSGGAEGAARTRSYPPQYSPPPKVSRSRSSNPIITSDEIMRSMSQFVRVELGNPVGSMNELEQRGLSAAEVHAVVMHVKRVKSTSDTNKVLLIIGIGWFWQYLHILGNVHLRDQLRPILEDYNRAFASRGVAVRVLWREGVLRFYHA